MSATKYTWGYGKQHYEQGSEVEALRFQNANLRSELREKECVIAGLRQELARRPTAWELLLKD